MRFLLDTNAMIAILADTASAVAQRVRREAPSDVGLSAVVVHELYYGAFKSQRVARNLAALDEIPLAVLAFTREDAVVAGEIRAALHREGAPIGPFDVLIAGQVKARDLILVTDNLREFRRIAGLKLESWSGKAI